MSELIPYRGLGCQGSAPYASPMPFVKQRRRGWLGRAAVSEHGAERPSQRGSADAASCGAPGACLRVTSGPPLPPRGDGSTGVDPRQGRLPGSLRDGLRPALTRTLV